MHNHSYENEFNFQVNDVSFSYESMSPRLALKKRFEEIRKWPVDSIEAFCLRTLRGKYFDVSNRWYAPALSVRKSQNGGDFNNFSAMEVVFSFFPL